MAGHYAYLVADDGERTARDSIGRAVRRTSGIVRLTG